MNRRTIHPIAPWLIAGVLLISGGIVFRVWAQQVTALTPGSGNLGSALSEDEPLQLPRLGSKIIPQSPEDSGENPRAIDPEQSSKIAVSPAVAVGGSSGGKSLGDSGSGEARTESGDAHALPTPASEPVQAGEPPLTESLPSGVSTDLQQPAHLDDSALFALLLDALSGASQGAQQETVPLPSPEPRLLRASQVLQIVYVEWALEEKITPLLTQAAAQRDVTAILAALRASHTGYRLVHLVGLAPRVGQAAPPDSPPRPEPVLWLTFDATEIDRIDWSAHPGRIARTIYDHAEYVRTEHLPIR